ncbi:MAG: acetylglutamate kinase [Prevotella sp.]|nr:acetylglutamate kinase [Prevotella sp.]
MRQPLNVVKVGGAIVEDEAQLALLISRFSAVSGRKVLVHGGGRSATRIAAALGIESQMVGGRRITDSETLKVVTMVYGGLVNKNIVALMQTHGIDAIGLTGADMDVIRAHRRPVRDIDYGFVGDVDRVDGPKLSAIIEQGITPVLAPLTHDGSGLLLNTNADTIAAEAAKALAPLYDVTLTYCFEKEGVLDNNGQLIPVITREQFTRYVADGTISGGMIPKIENALDAISHGVGRVVITQASSIDQESGTTIC